MNNDEENMENEGSREDHLIVEGQVIAVNRDKFTIKSGASEIIAQISGKMRQNKIRILLNDIVKVKISPYDMTRGIISSRE